MEPVIKALVLDDVKVGVLIAVVNVSLPATGVGVTELTTKLLPATDVLLPAALVSIIVGV